MTRVHRLTPFGIVEPIPDRKTGYSELRDGESFRKIRTKVNFR